VRRLDGLLPSFAKASEGLRLSSEAAEQRRRIAGHDRVFVAGKLSTRRLRIQFAFDGLPSGLGVGSGTLAAGGGV
jgi:hypothetical protein